MYLSYFLIVILMCTLTFGVMQCPRITYQFYYSAVYSSTIWSISVKNLDFYAVQVQHRLPILYRVVCSIRV